MKRRDRKEVLIEKAGKLFLKYGYEKTTMSDLARAAGIKAPTIYYHVESKEELLSLVFGAGAKIFDEKVIDEVNRLDDPEDKIRTIIKNTTEIILSRGEIPLLLDGPVDALPRREPKWYRTRGKETVKFMEGILRDLKISRKVEDSIDVTLATFILIGMSVWIYKWYNPKGRISQEELIDGMIKLFLHGFYGEKAKGSMTVKNNQHPTQRTAKGGDR